MLWDAKFRLNASNAVRFIERDLELPSRLDGPDALYEEICMIAALEGRKDIVTMGKTFGVNLAARINDEVMGEIAAKGDLEMVQLLLGLEMILNCFPAIIGSVIDNSAQHGHINILKWLFNDISNGKRRDSIVKRKSESMFLAASESGHLDIIKWGKDIAKLESYEFCKYGAFCNALKGGHISLVRWYRGQDVPFDEYTLPLAAESRKIALLEYLLEYECPNDNPLTCASVFSSESEKYQESLHVLQWLREQHNTPWDESTCYKAAETGNIDALKWARENGCPWDEGTLCAAAKMGHFHIVNYCLENGCPVADGHVYNKALSNLDIPDALKMIKLLWTFDVPLNGQVCAGAAGYAHIEALKWLRSVACPWDLLQRRTLRLYACAVRCEEPIEILKILKEHNHKSWTVSTVQFCIDNNCPVNDDDSLYACAVRCEEPIEILKILKEHNHKSWTADTSAVAAEVNNIRVLQWLKYNGCAWNEWVCHEAV
ncbi:hypothetical protein CTEN210_09852 [Chaetoceros tenuissimus]|uniref:Ankyrin repeat-containing domain n=1 Tax=Chaetoceros tenuissimus TaxID=426638 RepID=A0AAD3CYA3_9STRA|nr:hypothetical protein CTEN210_09852 [Chaetoceros tenuissimus]